MFLYMYIAPGQRQTIPWSIFFYIGINPLSLWSFAVSFFHLNDFLIFSIQKHKEANLTLPKKRSRSTQGHYLNKLWCAQGQNATHQSPRSLALWFRRFLKGFYHIWAWWPSWSCEPDCPNKLSFPRPMETPHEIWLWLAKWFWSRSLKMETDRQTTEHGSIL